MVFLDFESTGTDPLTDRIIQFAFVKQHADPNLHDGWSGLVNPGCPIPKEVSDLTGITDEQVADAPPFKDVAPKIAEFIEGQPLCGFNVLRFDVPLLAEEFERCDVPYKFGPIVDLDPLFKQHHTRKLSDAVRIYLGREHDGAHRADADTRACQQVYHAMLAQWDRLKGLSIEEIAKLSAYDRVPADPHGLLVWINGEMCYTHKKVRGVPVRDDIGYGLWMLRQSFPASTRRVLQRELDRLDDEQRASPEAINSEAGEPF